jgi:hypothetical protein
LSSRGSSADGPRARLTSESVLAMFPDLPDTAAPLFRSLLKSVAKLERGFWVSRVTD